MSQCSDVLKMLKHSRGRGITQFDAIRVGILRLAARIKDLRDAGHQIETIPEHHHNGTHARYVLRG